jgi:hypothetical protein
MGRLNSLSWVLGIVAALGLLATLAISQQPVDPFRKENVLFLSPFWVVGRLRPPQQGTECVTPPSYVAPAYARSAYCTSGQAAWVQLGQRVVSREVARVVNAPTLLLNDRRVLRAAA